MVSIGFVLPACGHWLYAADQAGFDLLWAYEEGKLESEAITLNYPEVPLFRNYWKERAFEVPDVIVGSPPCQGFSSLNTQKIDRPEKNQGIIKYAKIVSMINPLLFIMENVPFVTKRWDYLDRAKEHYKNYNLMETFLESSQYGAYQKRKRYFLAGIRRDVDKLFNFPKPNFITRTVEEAIGDLESKPRDFHEDHIWNPRLSLVFNLVKQCKRDKPFFTITSYTQSTRHYNGKRNISLLEAKRIMGLPDDWKLSGRSISSKMKAIAEGVDITLLKYLFESIKEFFEG